MNDNRTPSLAGERKVIRPPANHVSPSSPEVIVRRAAKVKNSGVDDESVSVTGNCKARFAQELQETGLWPSFHSAAGTSKLDVPKTGAYSRNLQIKICRDAVDYIRI
jgi:hypothetical protein